MNLLFVIEDEQHSEQCGEFDSFELALQEIQHRASLPWSESPNRCSCSSWSTCQRTYEIVEYDVSQNPWAERQRKAILTMSKEGAKWESDGLVARRFLVPPSIVRTPEERRQYWERVHVEQDYDTIWSMTEDHSARQKLIRFLQKLPSQETVLIPGCGSRTILQEEISRQMPSLSEIGCCDFPEVVKIAAARTEDPKIQYYERDISTLEWSNKWDSIVAVNCVLSHDDLENRKILRSFYEALRPGGYLIGFFPTLLSLYEIGHLENDPIGAKLLQRLDFRNNVADEGEQGGSQVLYTPIRLRYVIREAGFALETMEIFFCDGEYFQRETRKQYEFGDSDIVIYELFVVAQKV